MGYYPGMREAQEQNAKVLGRILIYVMIATGLIYAGIWIGVSALEHKAAQEGRTEALGPEATGQPPSPANAPAATQRAPSVPFDDGRGIRVWVDPDTGCEYLLHYSDGITPRMEGATPNSLSQRQRGCRR